jgi:hypothetical protein
VTSAIRHATRALTPLTAAGIITALGYPAIAIAAGLIVAALITACWILSSNARTERLTRIILARHGNAKCLPSPDNAKAAAGHRQNNPRPRRQAA